MGKKKQHHEEHVDEAWLLPYADMLTLLLALFIVMFAMSQVDKEKLQKAAEQFNIVFAGGTGVLENSGSTITPGNTTMSQIVEQDKMVSVKSTLEEEIKKSGHADKVKVELNGEGLLISMQDTVLFNSGDAEILTGFHPALTQISTLIKGFNNDIRIAGHTDNLPISNSKFHSNWDLSYTRSLNVMKFMVSKGGLPANKFSVQAFAEYKPKFDNSTPDGRAKNRRVEILIVRNHPTDKEKDK
ncbi:flagellar motor protein MotB [Clostridium cylindrosporum]|uniref:Motility protein B n=1 Tax=Clostridium cylindrosporum DSM 605 TaxID=1121307 RepID=A0A0J8D7S3_CLOCY|nr:flagellar motor protein MotB [Clostridium cylindrosporum]KMT21932.1 motility protein B [Clostridium cylindrosporum DSM 605]